MAFELPPLPYDYNALEPHIDEMTMRGWIQSEFEDLNDPGYENIGW